LDAVPVTGEVFQEFESLDSAREFVIGRQKEIKSAAAMPETVELQEGQKIESDLKPMFGIAGSPQGNLASNPPK